MHHLAQQGKLRLEGIGEPAQLAQEIQIQAVGHVQPQAVDAELLHPAPDGGEDMLHHRRVAQVQLDQVVVAFPALVPEAIVLVGVAAEVDMEPVLVGAGLPVAAHILKGPEAPAHVVEHPVQQHPQPCLMERLTHRRQILIGAQAAVQGGVIPGVIAVGVALEHRIQQHRIAAQVRDVLRPALQTADAGHGLPVVLRGCAAQAQRVDLIDGCVVKPHRRFSPYLSPARGRFIPLRRYRLRSRAGC